MKRLLSAAAAMMVLGSGAALAQPMGFDGHGARGQGHHERGHGRGGMRGLRILEAADLNGDNTVNRAEIETLQAEEFAWRDRNGDGFLDQADASPMRMRMMALREDRPNRRNARRGEGRGFDADEDGRVSADEFMMRSGRMFERLDANSDGAVSPDELDAHMQARAERREARRAPWWRD
ncbi:hypothetical protein [Oceanicaulis sp. MMSF_3324]|uniref:hypothetical protein n=1 Tax=Oceanicaulis sp. MMSF_3324 TaxID=3046702 RepID=UPI00273ED7EE|nr:hypothetical protein [Oceanicaulis sp. MMSF_3324]